MEHQQPHLTELLFPGQAAAGSPPAKQGCRSTGQTCQGTQGEDALGTHHLVEGKERGLSKEQPILSIPTTLLHWACTKHPGENHVKSYPETLASSSEVLRSVSELFVTCTSYTLKNDSKQVSQEL